jgi:hypothetical protein
MTAGIDIQDYFATSASLLIAIVIYVPPGSWDLAGILVLGHPRDDRAWWADHGNLESIEGVARSLLSPCTADRVGLGTALTEGSALDVSHVF